MRFKTPALKAEWETMHPTLKAVVTLLDVAMKRVNRHVTITCVHRPNDLDSYHSCKRACDIRIWRWGEYKEMVTTILRTMKYKISHEIQHEWESDHLHIEIDNGTIKKERR